jgi:autotransporter passenger strand-loop-strand repeat protein
VTVSSGGVENVSAIGSVSSQVLSGGQEFVAGRDTSTTVNSGGIVTVLNNGVASFATVNAGGEEIISSGGEVLGVLINSGGAAIVSSGGTLQLNLGDTPGASGVTLQAGATLVAAFGYILSNYTVSSGITLQDTANGTLVSASVLSGGAEIVNAAGSATTVSAGGIETVAFSGVESGGSDAGLLIVSNGGTLINETVLSGGTETVLFSGVASGGSDTGLLIVSRGGTLTSETILSGGTLKVFSGATINNLILRDARARERACSSG